MLFKNDKYDSYLTDIKELGILIYTLCNNIGDSNIFQK